ncbi:hypothetical protein P9D42_05000 [Bacillus haynesii]|uniref:hypothetical protein n=4 Tax=Bacillaceae TaxID=186817 RepID=UPI002DBB0DD4|nr:hypothetical protein [Bacillus haynesii]MEC1505025.1 hypothetical protein [Bacillus haynesii]
MKVKKAVIPARKLEGSRFDIGDKLGSFKASTEIALMAIRDYIHVLDLASAHLAALDGLYEDRLKQNVYNVGTGAGHSVKEIIETAENMTERSIAAKTDERRAGDPPVLVADSRTLQEDTGWKPQYSNLQTIIQSAWQWHRAYPDVFEIRLFPARAAGKRPGGC